MGERRTAVSQVSAHNTISIHAPCGGSDITTTLTTLQEKKFQSTLPVGGATLTPPPSASTPAYFNPRSPWGERPGNIWFCCVELPISIHAPRGGSDGSGPGAAADHERFQSTLPVGGATHGGLRLREVQGISIHAPRGGSDSPMLIAKCATDDFNPRSPWGERHQKRPGQHPWDAISIHAPRGGSDGEGTAHSHRLRGFQSTLPVGGATGSMFSEPDEDEISIHAPRGGSDGNVRGPVGHSYHFNPRSPWGERRVVKGVSAAGGILFQSTLPVGGATPAEGLP